MAPEQQIFHLDHRLLGISPWAVSVLLWWKVATSKFGCRTNMDAVMQTRSHTVEMPYGVNLAWPSV